MLGTIYLTIIILFGISNILILVDTNSIYNTISGENFSKKIPKILFIIPSGIILGIMYSSFTNYIIIYILNLISKNNDKNYTLGIILTNIIFLIISIQNLRKLKNKKQEKINYKKKYIVYFFTVSVILVLLTSFIMIHCFRIVDDELKIGFGVYGDLAIHTAMTSSFGVGGNIPTSYMYFAEDGINWHFFFYFFSGILNYLGYPIDLAINIPSIITMTSALMLLGLISSLLAKNKLAFLISPLLVFFRSAFNIFIELKEMIITNTPITEKIIHNSDWSKVAPYDDWGFWTLNIYTNQRHFMIGMATILILIILFLPYVIDMINSLKNKKIKETIKILFLEKKSWIIDKKDKRILISLILIITLPYFHGSALISILLILFVFAIFSKNKLSYLIIAIIAIISSLIQTNIFSGETANVLEINFQYGFILGEVSFLEILKYIITITGLMLFLTLACIIINIKNRLLYTILAISFLFPGIFAFLFKITIEMQNNHKFIHFSIILLDIFVAIVISKLIYNKNNVFSKTIIGIILLILVTSTGIKEFFTFINRNNNYVSINTKSEIIEWIKNNTEKNDVFLTPRWIGNRFFLTGRASFLAYPYYAWTTGHDTYLREEQYEYLLKGADENKELFINMCKKYNIKYIIEDIDLMNEKNKITNEKLYNKDFINNNFELVFELKNENTRIYQIYN